MATKQTSPRYFVTPKNYPDHTLLRDVMHEAGLDEDLVAELEDHNVTTVGDACYSDDKGYSVIPASLRGTLSERLQNPTVRDDYTSLQRPSSAQKAWDESDSDDCDSQGSDFAAVSPFQTAESCTPQKPARSASPGPKMVPIVNSALRRFELSMPIKGVHMPGLFSNAALTVRKVAQPPLEMKEICFRVADEWLDAHAPEVRGLELFSTTPTHMHGVITQPVRISKHDGRSNVTLMLSDTCGTVEPVPHSLLSVNLELLCATWFNASNGSEDKETGDVYYYKDLGHKLTLVEITTAQDAAIQVNFGVLHGKNDPVIIYQSQWVHPETVTFDHVGLKGPEPLDEQQLAQFSEDAISGSRVSLSCGHYGTLYQVDDDDWSHVHVQGSRTLEGSVRSISRYTKQLRADIAKSMHPDDSVCVQLLNGTVEVEYARDEDQNGEGNMHLYQVDYEDPSIVCQATDLDWYKAELDSKLPIAIPSTELKNVCQFVSRSGGFKDVKLLV